MFGQTKKKRSYSGGLFSDQRSDSIKKSGGLFTGKEEESGYLDENSLRKLAQGDTPIGLVVGEKGQEQSMSAQAFIDNIDKQREENVFLNANLTFSEEQIKGSDRINVVPKEETFQSTLRVPTDTTKGTAEFIKELVQGTRYFQQSFLEVGEKFRKGIVQGVARDVAVNFGRLDKNSRDVLRNFGVEVGEKDHHGFISSGKLTEIMTGVEEGEIEETAPITDFITRAAQLFARETAGGIGELIRPSKEQLERWGIDVPEDYERGVTPTTDMQALFFDAEKGETYNLQSIGDAWGEMVGVEFDPRTSTLIGVGQIFIDIPSGGWGSKAIRSAAKKISKTKSVPQIKASLSRMVRGSDDDITRLAQAFRHVDDPAEVTRILKATEQVQRAKKARVGSRAGVGKSLSKSDITDIVSNINKSKRAGFEGISSIARDMGGQALTKAERTALNISRAQRTAPTQEAIQRSSMVDDIVNATRIAKRSEDIPVSDIKPSAYIKSAATKFDKVEDFAQNYRGTIDFIPAKSLKPIISETPQVRVETFYVKNQRDGAVRKVDFVEPKGKGEPSIISSSIAPDGVESVMDSLKLIDLQRRHNTMNRATLAKIATSGDGRSARLVEPVALTDNHLTSIWRQARAETPRKIGDVTRRERGRTAERVAEVRRQEELKRFRQRIEDRTVFMERGLREGRMTTKKEIRAAGDEIIKELKRSGVPQKDLGKFNRFIRDIEGFNDLAKKLPELRRRIDNLLHADEIRQLKTKIYKEIKKTTAKVGKSKVRESEYGAEAQRGLDFLSGRGKALPDNEWRQLLEETSKVTKKGNIHYGLEGDRLKALRKVEEIQNKYGKMADGTFPEMPSIEAQKVSLLELFGTKDQTVAELRKTLNEITNMKRSGRMSTWVDTFNKSSELDRVKVVGRKETASPKMRPATAEQKLRPGLEVASKLEDWTLGTPHLVDKATLTSTMKLSEWVENSIHSMRGLHQRSSVFWNNKLKQGFRQAFGEKTGLMKIGELSRRKRVFSGKDATGKSLKNFKMNEFEAAYWWAQAQDPYMVSTFTENMKFTPRMFKELDRFVSPEMKRYTRFLTDQYFPEARVWVNEARYKTKFGTEIPDRYYLPTLREGTKMEDLTNLFSGEAFPNRASTVKGFLKTKTGSKAKLEQVGIDHIARRYTEQMNQFVHFDETVSDLRRVFMDDEIKNNIVRSTNRHLYESLMKKIDDIARGGTAANMKLQFLDRIIGNFTGASLMFNVVPLVKQITSAPAFTMGRGGVKYSEYMQGSIEYFSNPVEWTKMFLNDGDFVYGRLTKGFNQETAMAFSQGRKNTLVKEVGADLQTFLTNSAITPTRGGDMIPILPGLTAKYLQTTKALRATGRYTPEQIHKKAILEAEKLATRTQQSPFAENLGRIQTYHSLTKAMTMYSTTPIQFFRETTGTARMWNRGQVTTEQAIRTLITSWVIIPQLFQFASSGGVWHSDRQLRALKWGTLNHYPAIGDLVGLFADAFIRGEDWKDVSQAISPLFSMGEDLVDGGVAFNKWVTGDDDAQLEALESFYSLLAHSTGALPGRAPQFIKGGSDILNEDAHLRRLFWSEWALDGYEEPVSTPSFRGGATRTTPQGGAPRGIESRPSSRDTRPGPSVPRGLEAR